MLLFGPYRRLTLKTIYKPKASEIRRQFLDYFIKDHGHKFIKSSSVIPFDDSSVAFVNAGMNQFKSVLLGIREPLSPTAANSQKCIRVGGKHNDLEVVGKDGSHHTFFEMLGNWSFGHYFKAEACSLALGLLTGPLRIDPSCLKVTFFGGNKEEGLAPDEECAHIWRALGLKNNQLIACGMKDNFWEMGPAGPCGPCTEIHVDYDGKLLELWNLVFVEYERQSDGNLVSLSCKHVDTGMGLERLTKVLQGVPSNYDTDIFTPLFNTIQKISKMPSYQGLFGIDKVSELDCAYRVLADHMRAVSIALADGMFPDQNQKLRRLLRRCLLISNKTFKIPGSKLTSELACSIAENLGDAFPELQTNLSRSLILLKHEDEVFNASRKAASTEWKKIVRERPELTILPGDLPGLSTAVNELKDKKEITGEVAFRLYDTYGLETSTIEILAKCLNLQVNLREMEHYIENQQKSSRAMPENIELLMKSLTVQPTEDNLKYEWLTKGQEYVFPQGTLCKILAILIENKVVSKAQTGDKCRMVLDKTCLYSESGGQTSDQGEIVTNHGNAKIEYVKKIGDFVIHHCVVTHGEVLQGEAGALSLDISRRLGAMQHHSATHLLNAALHQLLPATYQRSSHVTSNYFTFDFTVFDKERLNTKDLQFLQDHVCKNIASELSIERTVSDISDVSSSATVIPGENYPDEVHLILIRGSNGQHVSIEPCCGTHCNNTRDILDFCIVAEKSCGLGVRSIRALAGESALQARRAAKKFLETMYSLEELIQRWLNGTEKRGMAEFQEAKKSILRTELPFLERQELTVKIENLEKKILERNRKIAKANVEVEMKNLLSSTASTYLVHILYGSGDEPIPLTKASNMCLPDRASLLLACDGPETVRARCCVPQNLVSESFNSEMWIQPVLNVFQGSGSAPKGQDPKLIFNMKPKHVQRNKQHSLVKEAHKEALLFLKARRRFSK